MVELGHADAVSHETGWRTRQIERRPHLREIWCIPPKGSAEFFCCVEDVPEVAHRPYDPRRPVVYMDENP